MAGRERRREKNWTEGQAQEHQGACDGGRELRGGTGELATLRSCYHGKNKPVGLKQQRERMHTLGQWEPMWEKLLALGQACADLEELSAVTNQGIGDRKEKRETARLHPRPTLRSHSAAVHKPSP